MALGRSIQKEICTMVDLLICANARLEVKDWLYYILIAYSWARVEML